MRIGVLALQGSVIEHLAKLKALGVKPIEVRQAFQVEELDGLIIPGGESTTLIKLMKRFAIDEAIKKKVASGMALWGTCAGMILMAQSISNGIPGQPSLELFPIEVTRNAFGRQLESCEVELPIAILGLPDFPAVFIRAPIASKIYDDKTEVLARLEDKPVALRYKNLLVTSFHPELTADPRVHSYFLSMLK